MDVGDDDRHNHGNQVGVLVSIWCVYLNSCTYPNTNLVHWTLLVRLSSPSPNMPLSVINRLFSASRIRDFPRVEEQTRVQRSELCHYVYGVMDNIARPGGRLCYCLFLKGNH